MTCRGSGVPTNIFRTALHPDGLAGRTRNFAQWSAYLLRRLDRAVVRTQDPCLAALELSMYILLSTFGTPMDVTLSDLSIELFFPADERSETILRRHA